MHMFIDRLWRSPVLVDLSIPNAEHFQSAAMETIIEGNDSFRRGQMLQAQIGSYFKSTGDYSLVKLNGHQKLKGHQKMNRHKKLNSHPKDSWRSIFEGVCDSEDMDTSDEELMFELSLDGVLLDEFTSRTQSPPLKTPIPPQEDERVKTVEEEMCNDGQAYNPYRFRWL
eukprot:Gb_30429 [translate_table: standard]